MLEATLSDLLLQLLLLSEIEYSLGQLPVDHAMSGPLMIEHTFNLTELKEESVELHRNLCITEVTLEMFGADVLEVDLLTSDNSLV